MATATRNSDARRKRIRMTTAFLLEYLGYFLDIFVKENAFDLVGARKTFPAVLLRKFNRLKNRFKVHYDYAIQGCSVWKLQDGNTRFDIIQIPCLLSSMPRYNFSAWDMTLLFSFSDPEGKLFYDHQKKCLLPQWRNVIWTLPTTFTEDKEIISLYFSMTFQSSFIDRITNGTFWYKFYNGKFWEVKCGGFKYYPSKTSYSFSSGEIFFADPLIFKGHILAKVYDSWKKDMI